MQLVLENGDLESISKKYHLNNIILFGSVLTDAFHQNSDIDIAVIAESISNLEECTTLILASPKQGTIKFIAFGLKQIFVDFFITVEDFTSMRLKELKQFKVGMDMRQALEVLRDEEVLDETLFAFLNKERLLRNRISHRYKEPSREELLQFIEGNHTHLMSTLEIVKKRLFS